VATDRHRGPQGLSPEGGRRTRVILDTNFLFIPIRFGVDIFEELERVVGGLVHCVVPSAVVVELGFISEGSKPSFKREVEFALSLIERCEIVDAAPRPGEMVDEVIARLAEGLGCPVATNDSDLRRLLRKRGIPVVYLRQRSHLEVDGII
jgi:rRNA-processing protein FCF1